MYNPAFDSEKFVTRDSGVKSVHSDGVQRDTQDGKTLFPLMFPKGVPMDEQLIVRVAELYTRGAEKYGDRNWEASSAEDTLDHHTEALWRHFMNFFFDVQDGEDHAAAIVWNINAVEHTRRNLMLAAETKATELLAAGDGTITYAERKILALRDRMGDYWQPQSDGTWACWHQGIPPEDDSLSGWSLDAVESAWGTVTRITDPAEAVNFPWA